MRKKKILIQFDVKSQHFCDWHRLMRQVDDRQEKWMPGQIPQTPTTLHVAVSLGSNITCRLYKLTLSHEAQAILQLTAICFRFSVKIFSRFTLYQMFSRPSASLSLTTNPHEASFLMTTVGSSWNVMAHGDAREGKLRGNWRMQWVASTLHTTSEHGVSSITTADAHTLAATSQLNWHPRRFK